MEVVDFQSLLTPEGQSILKEISEENPTEKTFLALFQKYTKTYERELVRSALSIAIARNRAKAKIARIWMDTCFLMEKTAYVLY